MNITPKKIEKVQDEAMRITWEDEHETFLPFRLLRQICPCAVCKDEWTGKRLLDPADVPEDLKGPAAQQVGNYALGFWFSDGHSSGVYTFQLLRESCRCASCAGGFRTSP